MAGVHKGPPRAKKDEVVWINVTDSMDMSPRQTSGDGKG